MSQINQFQFDATSAGKENQRFKIEVKDLSVWYDNQKALNQVNLNVFEHEILGVIGPSNSGKTSFLKTLNRLNDLYPRVRYAGDVTIDDKSIFKQIHPHELRRRVGVVFALPLPLPMSIFDNIAYGPRLHGTKDHKQLVEVVEKSLRAASIWDEVKDRLKENAFKLSGGQQQRLCIARTLAVEPEIILYDEPCSGLDPISTLKVEESMQELRKSYTQILVTNNTKQAARVSDRTAFFLMGDLIEIGQTKQIFTAPKDQRTEDYITGRFG